MNSLEQRNAKAINDAAPLYERINNAWAKAEEYIRDIGVLAPVEFCYDEDEVQAFGVQKRKGKWRICVGEYDNNDNVEWTPISDCSLDLRVTMMAHVPSLIEKVVEENELAVPSLQKVAEHLEASLKRFNIP